MSAEVPHQIRQAALRDIADACRRAMAVLGPNDRLYERLASAADGLDPPGAASLPPEVRRPLTVLPGGRR